MVDEHGELPEVAPVGERGGTQHSTRHTQHSSYRVRLDLFEGPLDLLLHLIKKSEVAVADIQVATITEQYLAYLEILRELNLDVAGEYLVMAATLTLLKSRMLLPAADADDEDGEDPRADLVRQLLEYQRYREAAQTLAVRPLLGRDVFAREANAEGLEASAGQVAVRATVWELLEALRTVLQRARPEPVQEVEGEAVSLRERVEVLLKVLSVARSITFDSLFGEEAPRGQIIVTFLALLELIKMGVVEAVQEDRCGAILIVLAVEDATTVSLDLTDEYGGRATTVEGGADEPGGSE